MLVLFGYTWALAHHMLGGMRHLLWDTGRGLQIWQVNVLSWLTIIGSVALTLAIWAVGLLLEEGCDMAYRTPLARVRGLGSAKSGADHFWRQRLTAVANIVLVAFLIWLVVKLAGADYATVKRTLAKPYIRHPAAAAGAVGRRPHAARYANHHRGLCAFRGTEGGSCSC